MVTGEAFSGLTRTFWVGTRGCALEGVSTMVRGIRTGGSCAAGRKVCLHAGQRNCFAWLPDGKGHERVACLCVLADRQDRAKAEEHFAKISAELPFWKRIKILHFWDGDLPKTATRKVKRR